MTAPDSRDSVERIAEELRAYDGDPFGTAKHVFRGWADRLQALSRGPQQAPINPQEPFSKFIAGPQQAGGEEHLKAMEARIDAIVSCAQGRWPEVTTLESAWDRMCADRNDKEAALAAARNELSCCDDVPLQDGLATGIANLREQRDAAEAALREAGRDAARYRWLRKNHQHAANFHELGRLEWYLPRTGFRGFATLDVAIDAAIEQANR